MAIRNIWALGLAAGLEFSFLASGHTATLAVNVVNNSSEAISGILAVAKNAAEAVPVEVLTSGLAADETGSMTITAEEDQCVFDLEITFATGAKLNWSDVDLCHTDGLVVE